MKGVIWKKHRLSNLPNGGDLEKGRFVLQSPLKGSAIFLWIRASWRLLMTSETVCAALHLNRSTQWQASGDVVFTLQSAGVHRSID